MENLLFENIVYGMQNNVERPTSKIQFQFPTPKKMFRTPFLWEFSTVDKKYTTIALPYMFFLTFFLTKILMIVIIYMIQIITSF